MNLYSKYVAAASVNEVRVCCVDEICPSCYPCYVLLLPFHSLFLSSFINVCFMLQSFVLFIQFILYFTVKPNVYQNLIKLVFSFDMKFH